MTHIDRTPRFTRRRFVPWRSWGKPSLLAWLDTGSWLVALAAVAVVLAWIGWR